MIINNLESKLSGLEPVTREELFELINSHGRKHNVSTHDFINIVMSNPNQCYPLENLNVSQIEDFSSLFRHSPYNGDLSKWDVSNGKNFNRMFSFSNFNNDSLKNWNVEKVENMLYMFYTSSFNGDLSGWNTSNVIAMESMFESSDFNNNSINNFKFNNCESLYSIFCNTSFDGDISNWDLNDKVDCDYFINLNQAFKNKYNNGEDISCESQEFKEWFEENRDKMREINTTKEEVLDFFSFPCFSEQVM